MKRSLIDLFKDHRPPEPFEGPLRVEITIVWPWKKSETKKNRARGFLWSDKRPDISNIIKRFEDVLTLLRFWNDDSQIAWETVKKGWGDNPGIGLAIWTLKEEE